MRSSSGQNRTGENGARSGHGAGNAETRRLHTHTAPFIFGTTTTDHTRMQSSLSVFTIGSPVKDTSSQADKRVIPYNASPCLDGTFSLFSVDPIPPSTTTTFTAVAATTPLQPAPSPPDFQISTWSSHPEDHLSQSIVDFDHSSFRPAASNPPSPSTMSDDASTAATADNASLTPSDEDTTENYAAQPAHHVPRPPNAWLLFRTDYVRRTTHPHKKQAGNPSKKASHVWRYELSDAEKRYWARQAEIIKEEHLRRNPGYKYRPLRKNARKPHMSPQMKSTSSDKTVVSPKDGSSIIDISKEVRKDDAKDLTLRFQVNQCSPLPIYDQAYDLAAMGISVAAQLPIVSYMATPPRSNSTYQDSSLYTMYSPSTPGSTSEPWTSEPRTPLQDANVLFVSSPIQHQGTSIVPRDWRHVPEDAAPAVTYTNAQLQSGTLDDFVYRQWTALNAQNLKAARSQTEIGNSTRDSSQQFSNAPTIAASAPFMDRETPFKNQAIKSDAEYERNLYNGYAAPTPPAGLPPYGGVSTAGAPPVFDWALPPHLSPSAPASKPTNCAMASRQRDTAGQQVLAPSHGVLPRQNPNGPNSNMRPAPGPPQSYVWAHGPDGPLACQVAMGEAGAIWSRVEATGPAPSTQPYTTLDDPIARYKMLVGDGAYTQPTAQSTGAPLISPEMGFWGPGPSSVNQFALGEPFVAITVDPSSANAAPVPGAVFNNVIPGNNNSSN